MALNCGSNENPMASLWLDGQAACRVSHPETTSISGKGHFVFDILFLMLKELNSYMHSHTCAHWHRSIMYLLSICCCGIRMRLAAVAPPKRTALHNITRSTLLNASAISALTWARSGAIRWASGPFGSQRGHSVSEWSVRFAKRGYSVSEWSFR